jgi:hypothetical protein
MVKKSFFIFLFLLSVFPADAKFIKGKIVRETDTLEVTFDIPVNTTTRDVIYKKLINKIKYISNIGVKGIIRPDQAKEIRFNYMNNDVILVSILNSLNLGGYGSKINVFLKLEIDGKVKMYSYSGNAGGGGMGYAPAYSGGYGGGYSGGYMMVGNSGGYSSAKITYILQNEEGEMVKEKQISKKEALFKFLKDCSAVKQRFENKEFYLEELWSVVALYNNSCGND